MQVLQTLARNLGQLREQRGLTLSGLSQRCGIAKSTLSGLEAANGNPTMETLWAIANALDMPFGRLISDDGSQQARISDKNVIVRFIERDEDDSGSCIESYRMHLEAGHTKESAAHPPGVREKVVVTNGPMLVGDALAPRLLNTGEVHCFAADVPHIYAGMGKAVQAMVFVEYPAPNSHPSQDLVQVLDWPATPAAWEGAASMLERMRIEVANGLSTVMLRFRHCALPMEQALNLLRSKLVIGGACSYRWPQSMVLEADQDSPYVMLLPRNFTRAFSGIDPGAAPSALWRRALELARRAEGDLIAGQVCLEADLSSECRVLQTLGAECALKSGILLLPRSLQLSANQSSLAVQPSTDAGAFSSRIQVEHYDAFELLHPAYARQAVAMAQDIAQFTQARHTVDVGTGPGLPLLMLQELLPGLTALAVEPDPVAYAYLQKNVEGNTAISAHRGGFLELDVVANSGELITSVGASHHFNTAFMLQKSWNLLKPGGVLSVADEFLPAFRDIDSRNLALVRHHGAYILDVISAMDCCNTESINPEEYVLYRAFRHGLAQAVFMAEQGRSVPAMRLCRQLFAEVRKASLDNAPKTSLGAYIRFFWLELQAMVAGFDYEVECKTHVRRFLELAAGTGFDLLRHRRVFGTCGDQPEDGGTHVMTFRKAVP